VFRIAAADYLDPEFLPRLASRVQQEAPASQLEIHPLTAAADYHAQLAQGGVDTVIGNWLRPPGELHQARLFADEIVCLVAADHPAVKRGWTAESWLAARHVAPTPTHPGARGVIDEHLEAQGLARNITARCAHFGLLPRMVASSLLILTTGRLFCERYLNHLPVRILPCPVPFPELVYYQLWHERSHASAAGRWLRERVKAAAAGLRPTQNQETRS